MSVVLNFQKGHSGNVLPIPLEYFGGATHLKCFCVSEKSQSHPLSLAFTSCSASLKACCRLFLECVLTVPSLPEMQQHDGYGPALLVLVSL